MGSDSCSSCDGDDNNSSIFGQCSLNVELYVRPWHTNVHKMAEAMIMKGAMENRTEAGSDKYGAIIDYYVAALPYPWLRELALARIIGMPAG